MEGGALSTGRGAIRREGRYMEGGALFGGRGAIWREGRYVEVLCHFEFLLTSEALLGRMEGDDVGDGWPAGSLAGGRAGSLGSCGGQENLGSNSRANCAGRDNILFSEVGGDTVCPAKLTRAPWRYAAGRGQPGQHHRAGDAVPLGMRTGFH